MPKRTSKAGMLAVKVMATHPCPVNERAAVKMSRSGFVSLCDHHRKTKGRGTFAPRLCDTCKIGKKIARGERFKPPYGVEFYSERRFLGLVGVYEARI